MKVKPWIPALSAVLVAACGWFDDGRQCKQGAWSCKGDEARVCVPSLDEQMAGPNGPKTSWMTVQTCEDEPVAGPRTCAVVEDRAQCVAEALDGGVAMPESEGEQQWLRVDVAADQRILSAQPQTLKGAPLAAFSGVLAVASYHAGEATDAVLVPTPASPEDAVTVWVRAEGTDAVALVDTKGTKLSEVSVGTDKKRGAVAEHSLALGAELPPTLHVERADTAKPVPAEYVGTALRPIAGTPEPIGLVGEGLVKLPTTAVSAVSSLVFVSGRDVADAGVDGSTGVALEAGLDASPADEAGTETKADASGSRLARSARVGATLWVDVSPGRLAEYRAEPSAVLELQLELLRHVGRAFVEIGSLGKNLGLVWGTPALPTDFPPAITALIQARISPMLDRGESLSTAWSNLHSMGVLAGIAGPYMSAWQSRTDKEAIDLGFASALGGAAVDYDFGEFLARATLEGGWPISPCDDIRGTKLDQLASRRMLTIAKLEVLRGLDVLEPERVKECVGELETSSTEALVLHKPNGEPVRFLESLHAVRADVNGQVQVAATAQNGGVLGVLDVAYRSALPGVLRLKKVGNVRAEGATASFALNESTRYSTLPAAGGLVVIDEVTRSHLRAHLLMVQVAPAMVTLDDIIRDPTLLQPVFGSTVFPLITVRINDVDWVDSQNGDETNDEGL